jgi:hypothetical protein
MRRLLGGLLLGCGILVMTCSGLCSLAFIVLGARDIAYAPNAIIMPLIFGGIPFAGGFALFRTGRSLLRGGVSDAD